MTLTAEPATITAPPSTDPAETASGDRIPPTTPAPIAAVIELHADHVAQHPDNLRDATRGIRELAASIAEVGVLVPLIVVPVAAVPDHEFDPAVTHVAVDGNRRQAAARQAGLPLPCIVRPDLDSAREHALTMAVTGLARDGLTAREEAHAVQAMLDFGIEPSAIARATGRTRKQVTTARKAARLTDELAATVAGHELTLTDLAALTEWQHDPSAVAELTDAIGRGQLAHALARLDVTRRERQIAGRATKDLTTAGVRCVDQRPTWNGTPRELLRIRAADAPVGQPLTPEAHADCPGHVAHVDVEIYERYPDDDGDPLDPEVTITYGCDDPTAHGHLDRWQYEPTSRTTRGDADDDSDLDEQSRADRAAERQRQQAETQARAEEARRQERRDLIRRNKEADAAQQVRRQFLRDSLTARSRHKDMTAYALDQVLNRDLTYSHWLTDYSSRDRVLTDILGDDPLATAINATGPRRIVMLWAYVAAAHEHHMPRDAHRGPDRSRADYLRHLEQIGYVLSDVEQLVITRAYPDDQPSTASGDDTAAEPTALEHNRHIETEDHADHTDE